MALLRLKASKSRAWFREALKNRDFVVPAQAGTQVIQAFLDARIREHDGSSEYSQYAVPEFLHRGGFPRQLAGFYARVLVFLQHRVSGVDCREACIGVKRYSPKLRQLLARKRQRDDNERIIPVA